MTKTTDIYERVPLQYEFIVDSFEHNCIIVVKSDNRDNARKIAKIVLDCINAPDRVTV